MEPQGETVPDPDRAPSTRPRLFIKEMVMRNFKSYAGEKRVGPFHKPRLTRAVAAPHRAPSPSLNLLSTAVAPPPPPHPQAPFLGSHRHTQATTTSSPSPVPGFAPVHPLVTATLLISLKLPPSPLKLAPPRALLLSARAVVSLRSSLLRSSPRSVPPYAA